MSRVALPARCEGWDSGQRSRSTEAAWCGLVNSYKFALSPLPWFRLCLSDERQLAPLQSLPAAFLPNKFSPALPVHVARPAGHAAVRLLCNCEHPTINTLAWPIAVLCAVFDVASPDGRPECVFKLLRSTSQGFIFLMPIACSWTLWGGGAKCRARARLAGARAFLHNPTLVSQPVHHVHGNNTECI